MKRKVKISFKKVITLIIILILLLIIKKGYEIYRTIISSNFYELALIDYDGKLDKSNPMTLKEIIDLLEKGREYNNYTVTLKYKSGNIGNIFLENHEDKIFIKDDIKRVTTDGQDIYWCDYNKNEIIYMNDFEAVIQNIFLPPVTKEEYFKDRKTQKVCSYDYLIVEEPTQDWQIPIELTYKYLGEKEINGRKTIIIKVHRGGVDYGWGTYNKFYIDKETGVIVSLKQYSYMNFIRYKYKNSQCYYGGYADGEFSVEFDCVTDEDVEKPNILGHIVSNAFLMEENQVQ